MLKQDIIRLYHTLLRYKIRRDKIPGILKNHFYFKVCDMITEEEFISKITQIIQEQEK